MSARRYDPLRLDVTTTWGNRTLDTSSPEWRRLRSRVLDRDDDRCRFCGFRASKYMVVDHINGRADDNRMENLGVNCAACDRIRHCGYAGMQEQLVPLISTMSQRQIVRLTRAFYAKHGRVPGPTVIDPNAQRVPLAMVDVANYLLAVRRGESVDVDVSMFRGFFTRKFARWQTDCVLAPGVRVA